MIQKSLVQLISVLKDAVLLLKQAETLLELTSDAVLLLKQDETLLELPNHVELEQELVHVKDLIKSKEDQIESLERILAELPSPV
jgi:hypothetical protein